MDALDTIINTTLDSFDFGLVVTINVLTYLIIKTIDDFNGDKGVDVKVKRVITIFSSLFVSFIYCIFGLIEVKLILNSAILAPVFWSWIGKPICKKFGIDYK